MSCFEVARAFYGNPQASLTEVSNDPTFPTMADMQGGIPFYSRNSISQYYLLNEDKFPNALPRYEFMGAGLYRTDQNIQKIKHGVWLTIGLNDSVDAFMMIRTRSDAFAGSVSATELAVVEDDAADKIVNLQSVWMKAHNVKWQDVKNADKLALLDSIYALLNLNADYSLIKIRLLVEDLRRRLSVKPGRINAFFYWIDKVVNPGQDKAGIEIWYSKFLKGRFRAKNHR
jgi:hypothetical protein